MRLLRNDTLELHNFSDESKIPEYAILSHTWLRPEEGEEVLFADMKNLGAAREKEGWNKLEFATRQATNDGLKYVWIDTCCIDKSSSAELSESVNSMYRWYSRSKVCYVHLDEPPNPSNSSIMYRDDYIDPVIERSNAIALAAAAEDTRDSLAGSQQLNHELGTMLNGCDELISPAKDLDKLARCRWFTRGWTLQEMIASPSVVFYDQSGDTVGTLHELADWIATVTGVHQDLLKGHRSLASFSISQKMNWASKRITTRTEDRAYSLLGLLDINLAVIYGEGERAFQRLQEELLRVNSDHTIFAWGYQEETHGRAFEAQRDVPFDSPLLATSPDDFSDPRCRDIIPTKRSLWQREYEVSQRCINFELPVLDATKDNDFSRLPVWIAVLNCCFEDRPTTLIALSLVCIGREFLRQSLGYCELYDAERRTRLCTLAIVRDFDRAYRSFGESIIKDRQREGFMLRCKCDKTGTPELRIESVEGRIMTNPTRKDLPATVLSDEAWDDVNGMFIVPLPSRNLKQAICSAEHVPEILEARVILRILCLSSTSESVSLTIRIFPGLTTDGHGAVIEGVYHDRYSIRIEYERPSKSFLTLPLFRNTFILEQARPLTANVTLKELLGSKVMLIEFEVRSRSQLPSLFFRELVSRARHGKRRIMHLLN